eukprot:g31242.t1
MTCNVSCAPRRREHGDEEEDFPKYLFFWPETGHWIIGPELHSAYTGLARNGPGRWAAYSPDHCPGRWAALNGSTFSEDPKIFCRRQKTAWGNLDTFGLSSSLSPCQSLGPRVKAMPLSPRACRRSLPKPQSQQRVVRCQRVEVRTVDLEAQNSHLENCGRAADLRVMFEPEEPESYNENKMWYAQLVGPSLTEYGSQKWRAAVATPSGILACPPWNASHVLRIDPREPQQIDVQIVGADLGSGCGVLTCCELVGCVACISCCCPCCCEPRKQDC